MNQDDQEQARVSIEHHVKSGFYDADEIAEILCEEVLDPETVDESWVLVQIEAEFKRKRLDEQTWQHPTDCERLDAAFIEMETRQIIALQNAGYTQSDGISDITESWQNRGGESSNVVGYCFFHGQDLERAVADEGLMLTFGDILGTDKVGLEVGNAISEILKKHGFQIEWNGTIQERISIPRFNWQKSSL